MSIEIKIYLDNLDIQYLSDVVLGNYVVMSLGMDLDGVGLISMLRFKLNSELKDIKRFRRKLNKSIKIDEVKDGLLPDIYKILSTKDSYISIELKPKYE